MPAVSTFDVVKRYERTGGRTLTPTAVGFLVPLLLVFLCAPFACVFFIRRRRMGQPPDYILNLRTPAQRKEEAREKLTSVTEVSTVISGDAKEYFAETASVWERECAICLSTLYAPSPPEPVKVAGGSAPAKAPSVSGLSLKEENEEILRLNVCGHEYHHGCLLSWFMVRKYSCPICRAVYYQSKKPEESAAANEEGQDGSPNEGGRDLESGGNVNSNNTTNNDTATTNNQNSNTTTTTNQNSNETRREQV